MQQQQPSQQITGVFAKDEKCIIFLDVMQNLVEKTLNDAYRAAANMKHNETTTAIIMTPFIAERFRYALDLIPVWPSNILEGEERRATGMCYQISDCYRHLVRTYAEEIFKDEPEHKITLTIPSCTNFIHEVYKQLILLHEVRSGLYFQLFGLHRKNVIVDAIRAALRNVISRGSAEHDSYVPPLSPGPSISRRELPPAAAAPMTTPILSPAPPAPPAPVPPPSASSAASSAPTPKPKPKPTLTAPPSRPPTTVSQAFERAIEVDLQPVTLGPPPSRPPSTVFRS